MILRLDYLAADFLSLTFFFLSSCPTTVRPGEKMDPLIQEEVPAVAAVDTAAAVVNGNGTMESSTTDDVGGEQPATAAATSGVPETSYDDLFPSLSSSQPADAVRGKTMGEWTRRPVMFASSVVTQVFTIPVEEQRKGGSGSFGADDSFKTIKTVMDKTGAKIEMSSSKDKSLTFLITGKNDVVLRARRELFSQFQVLERIHLISNEAVAFLISCPWKNI